MSSFEFSDTTRTKILKQPVGNTDDAIHPASVPIEQVPNLGTQLIEIRDNPSQAQDECENRDSTESNL